VQKASVQQRNDVWSAGEHSRINNDDKRLTRHDLPGLAITHHY